MGFPTTQCGSDETECNYPADGCLKKKLVGDGTIDCLRDGFDETLQARFLVEENVHNGQCFDCGL